MNILAITGILPVPGLLKSNDFVFQTYMKYIESYPQDHVLILKPTQYKSNIKKLITRLTDLKKLQKKKTWEINGFQVEILPYYSARRFRNLHAILAFSLLLLNKNRIRAILDKGKFDIIHAQYIFPDGLLAFLLSRMYRIPYLITTHNELFYFKHFVSRRLALRVVRNAALLLPLNHMNFTYFRSLGMMNLKLLPLGFHDYFCRDQKQVQGEKVKILTVAELIKLKNIDKVIKAIHRSSLKHKLTYTIVGMGPEREKLKNLVIKLKLEHCVTFVDHIPHEKIADEMYKHDIFVMPSYFETFGRVYFEAMAMGIPVICAKNSGIYGYFKENEEGISVNHRNVNELCNTLDFLITHEEERKRIGRQGQMLAVQYSWDRIVENLHALYKDTLSNRAFK